MASGPVGDPGKRGTEDAGKGCGEAEGSANAFAGGESMPRQGGEGEGVGRTRWGGMVGVVGWGWVKLVGVVLGGVRRGRWRGGRVALCAVAWYGGT